MRTQHTHDEVMRLLLSCRLSNAAIAEQLGLTVGIVRLIARGGCPTEKAPPPPRVKEERLVPTCTRQPKAAKPGPAKPAYLPSQSQIAEACEAIRRMWSPIEQHRRYMVAHSVGSINDVEGGGWTAPVCDGAMAVMMGGY